MSRAQSVLLAYQDRAAAEGLARALEASGMAVDVAETAPAMLDSIAASHPQLVLTDLLMRPLDELTLRRLRYAADRSLILVRALPSFGESLCSFIRRSHREPEDV